MVVWRLQGGILVRRMSDSERTDEILQARHLPEHPEPWLAMVWVAKASATAAWLSMIRAACASMASAVTWAARASANVFT
jgi:adenylate kinase